MVMRLKWVKGKKSYKITILKFILCLIVEGVFSYLEVKDKEYAWQGKFNSG